MFLWMLIVFLVAFFSSTIFTALLVYYRTTDLVEAADERLLMAAEMSREILGPGYHDGIVDSSSISRAQFIHIVQRNDDLCRRFNLQYIWSVLSVDNHLVFTSATHSDITNPQSACAAFFDIHHDPEAFASAMGPEMSPVYSSFKNEWGEGRMVLVPRNDARGWRYIFGASVQLTQYNAVLKRAVITSLIIGLSIFLCACIPVYFLSRRMRFLIARIVDAADNMAAGDLEVTLPHMEFSEIHSLAHSLDTMRQELKLKIKALRESATKYRYLYETMAQGVVLQDADGKIVEANNAACEILGLTMDQMLGKTPYDPRWKLIHEDGSPFDPDDVPSNIALRTGKPAKDVSCGVYIPEEDEYRWIVIGSTPQFNGDEKKPFLTMTVFTNITERKKNERRFAQAQKIEAVGTLAGGIAHDFNNMLYIILGNIELIKEKLPRDDKKYALLKDAETAVLRAKDLTQKFITFASGGAPIKARVMIGDLIDGVRDVVLSGTDIQVETAMAEGIAPVEMDKGQIRQAFVNILENAKNAMPEGGKLVIEVTNTSAAYENSRLSLDMVEREYVKILISDNGIGIPQKHIGQIFDPYFSTKPLGVEKGMGLGLAIVHSIIKSHDGYVYVASTMKKGTDFYIYLPACGTISRKKEGGVTRLTLELKRILIMDDEKMVLEMSRQMLELLGYDVAVASNGVEAVDVYREALGSPGEFDLVILDLTVKGGMGGVETLKKLKEINPDVQGIIISGYSADPIMSDYRNHGFVASMTKPITIEALKAKLTNLFVKKECV